MARVEGTGYGRGGGRRSTSLGSGRRLPPTSNGPRGRVGTSIIEATGRHRLLRVDADGMKSGCPTCDRPSPPPLFFDLASVASFTECERVPRLDGAGVTGGPLSAMADTELLLAVGAGDRGEPMRELYRRYSTRI